MSNKKDLLTKLSTTRGRHKRTVFVEVESHVLKSIGNYYKSSQ